jgi:hypothetical protein
MQRKTLINTHPCLALLRLGKWERCGVADAIGVTVDRSGHAADDTQLQTLRARLHALCTPMDEIEADVHSAVWCSYFALEDANGSHACSLPASMRVIQ